MARAGKLEFKNEQGEWVQAAYDEQGWHSESKSWEKHLNAVYVPEYVLQSLTYYPDILWGVLEESAKLLNAVIIERPEPLFFDPDTVY